MAQEAACRQCPLVLHSTGAGVPRHSVTAPSSASMGYALVGDIVSPSEEREVSDNVSWLFRTHPASCRCATDRILVGQTAPCALQRATLTAVALFVPAAVMFIPAPALLQHASAARAQVRCHKHLLRCILVGQTAPCTLPVLARLVALSLRRSDLANDSFLRSLASAARVRRDRHSASPFVGMHNIHLQLFNRIGIL